MGLDAYRNKRNFRNTPEPEGKVLPSGSGDLSFVIQMHAASHLHYDFRLELNGVLLSWAVPKGPSLDPNDKRLAVHVEDHPKEYGGFEGVIPPKQYGSGTVMLWDQGTWLPTGDPEASYQKGKLKFQLQGKKLRGGWTLVRSHGSKYGEKSWLLIKEEDSFARLATEGVITEIKPRSVLTGRSLEEIAAHPDRVWHSTKSVAENLETGAVKKKRRSGSAPGTLSGAVKGPLAARMSAQLATLVKKAPSGDQWLHEIKLDGYRMLCRVENGGCRIYSRTGKDWTANFAAIAHAAARLPCASAWIDGEVVVLAGDGRTSFQALQNALSQESVAKVHFYAFDLPYLDGYDLRKAALIDRKRLLQGLVQATGELRFSDHVVGAGKEFFDQACNLRLEGIISKRVDSPYEAVRGASWVKTKCSMSQEMVVGGFTEPQNSRTGFGALLLGFYDGVDLRYAGKVGTGFDDATLAKLRPALDALVQSEPPFINPPRGAEARRARWVAPNLVAQIAFTEWTQDETLRHAAFMGLRADKRATDVVRERAVATPVAAPPAMQVTTEEPVPITPTKSGTPRAQVPSQLARGDAANTVAGITISNPGKSLFPEAQLSKRDLALYYRDMSEWILPHLENRPVTLVRCPDGWEKECFYQKNATGSAQVVDRVQVETSDGPAQYMMANSTSALVALLQMGALELHPWGSQAAKLGFPDRLIFDFDPDEDLPWESLKEATEILRTLLGEIGLQGFLKTTGGKGLHVVLPVQPTLPWDEAKAFTKAIASLLVRTFPDRFTDKLLKSTRQGKIFVDYLRNGEGATAVSPFSIRAKANAPVAVPIAWEETAKDLRFAHFNVRTVQARMKRQKRDPWSEFFTLRQTVTSAILKKVGAAGK